MKSMPHIERLRSAIVSGKLRPGEMVGTEFAFSQKWGISRNTVRRGIDTLISAGLLERRPGKGLYVRLPHTVTRSIQVVVPSLAWSYHFRVARGAQSAARESGVAVLLYDAQGDIDHALTALQRLPDSSFDGAVIISLHDRRFSEKLFSLKSAGYPFVLVDQRLHDLETATIEIDNYGGGYLVGQKLAENNHSRVMFLGPLNLQVVSERLSGFRDAMLDARVLFDRSLVVDLGGEGLTDWMNERAAHTEAAIIELLDRPNRPTAVFDGSGDIAPFVYRAAEKLGLRIPHDLSIISFDDSPFGRFFEPEVSRLKHPWDDAGRLALEMLLQQLLSKSRGSATMPFEHRVMKAEWVAGGSLAPAVPPA